jgi:hypothetical protein
LRRGINRLKPMVAELQQIGTDWHRRRANKTIINLRSPNSSLRQGIILCEALWDHPYHWPRVAMLSRALGPKYGSELLGLYTEETPRRWRSSLEALQLAGMERVALDCSPLHRQQAEQFLQGLSSMRGLSSARLPGGCPAAYIYDGALKQERVGFMEFSDERLPHYFALAFCYLEQYEAILDRREIKAAIVSHPTHVRFSTLVWTLISRDVPVYLTNYVNGHITIRRMDEACHMLEPYDDSPDPDEVEALNAGERQALIEQGKSYMGMVRGGDESEFARVKVYGDGEAHFSGREEFCAAIGADPAKPIVAIMGNCWPDFPNSFGPTWFSDYVDWFRVTLNTVADVPNCNWVLKPHPAELEYGQNTTLRKLAGERLPPGVFHWPEGASGVDLALYAHGVVTARGTSGVEYAGIGLRVIVGAPTSYTSHGFVHFAETEREYCELLAEMHQLPAHTQKQQEDAQIFSAATFAHLQDKLRYPSGHLGRQLYRGLPEFVRVHREAIEAEIQLMANWVRSGHGRYHSWSVLHSASSLATDQRKKLATASHS